VTALEFAVGAGCLAIAAGLLVFFFLLPPVALAHCALAQNDSSRLRRWLWAAVVLLLWPWGSLIYFLFGSRSRALQVVGVVFLLVNLVLLRNSQLEVREAETGAGPEIIENYPDSSEAGRLRLTHAWGELAKPGWGNYVKSVAWSSDGKQVLVGRSHTLELREVESGRLLSVLESLPANGSLAGWSTGKWLGRGVPVALSPDGRFALADEGDVSIRSWLGLWVLARQLVQGDRRVRWWDLENDRSGYLTGHRAGVRAIRFRPEGSEAVTASFDATVKVWDVEQAENLATLEGHPLGVIALAVSHDGHLAISGGLRTLFPESNANILWLWNLDERRAVRALDGHTDRVLAVGFSADDRLAVSAGFDKTFRVWDLESGTEVRRIETRAIGDRITFSPDARFAAGGRWVVEIWDLERGAVIDAIDLRGMDDGARAISFSPTGDRLVIGTRAGALLFYSWPP